MTRRRHLRSAVVVLVSVAVVTGVVPVGVAAAAAGAEEGANASAAVGAARAANSATTGEFSVDGTTYTPDPAFATMQQSDYDTIQTEVRAFQLDPVKEAAAGGDDWDRYMVLVDVTLTPRGDAWSVATNDQHGPTMDLVVTTDDGHFPGGEYSPETRTMYQDSSSVSVSAGVSSSGGASAGMSASATWTIPETQINVQHDRDRIEWTAALNVGYDQTKGNSYTFTYATLMRVPEGTKDVSVDVASSGTFFDDNWYGDDVNGVSTSGTYTFQGKPPNPTIETEDVMVDSEATVGEDVTFEITATNHGGTADWGSLQLSFPDGPEVVSGPTGDFPDSGLKVYRQGDEIWGHYGEQKVTLDYVHVEGAEGPWLAGETRTLSVTVRPPAGERKWHTEDLTVEEKFVMGWGGTMYADPVPDAARPTDQQDERVYRNHYGVVDPPTSLSISPGSASVSHGDTESFSATVTYRSGVEADVTGSADWRSRNSDVLRRQSGTAFEAVAPGITEAVASYSERGYAVDAGAAVEVPNQRPTADPGGSYTTGPGETVELGGSGSEDRDTAGLSAYEWRFEGSPGVRDGSTATPRVEYDSPGTYTVELRVKDDEGEWSEWTSTAVEVVSVELEVVDATLSPAEVDVGETATVEATVENKGSASGEGAVTLSVDGETVDSSSVELDEGESTTVSFQISFAEPGTYPLTVGNAAAGDLTVVEASTPTQTATTTPGPTTTATPTSATTPTDATGTPAPTEEDTGDGATPTPTESPETTDTPAETTADDGQDGSGATDVDAGSGEVGSDGGDEEAGVSVDVEVPGFGSSAALLALLVVVLYVRRRNR